MMIETILQELWVRKKNKTALSRNHCNVSTKKLWRMHDSLRRLNYQRSFEWRLIQWPQVSLSPS